MSSNSLSSLEPGESQNVLPFYDTERKPGQDARNSFSSDQLRAYSSSLSSGHLSRHPTGYSAKEIYGDIDPKDISLRRTNTRGTIIDQLAERVLSVRQAEERDIEEGISVRAENESFYENIPDVSVPTKDFGEEFTAIDPELITWEGDNDPNFPRNWTLRKKSFQTFIVALYTLVSPMSSSMPSLAINDIAVSLGMQSEFLKSFSISIMVLAWAIGPLVIAPLSESDRIGRLPVLNASIWLVCLFNLVCAWAKTPAQLCVFRFLAGICGCAPLNVGAGSLSDMFDNKSRLVAMAFYSICPSCGPIVSAVISGFIVENLSWQWTFWILAIFNCFVAILGTIFFRETYSPKLLKVKAQKLREETGNEHLHTIFEIANGETAWRTFLISISRPITLLFTHPMVMGLGSFMAFIYGFMYLMIVTFPEVFGESYGFNIGVVGLMYLGMGIGMVLGIAFFTYAIQYHYDVLTKRNGGVSKPEYRLPWLCASGVLLPAGLVWYGWSAQKRLHWIMPMIGSGIFGFVLTGVFQAIQNYLIDMNTRYAASSIAAAAVFRSLFGFAFPLFATPMYNRLNYGWGNTMCALIALALGVPFPLFCLKYGEQLREYANKRMDRKQALRDEKNLRRLQEQNREKEMEHAKRFEADDLDKLAHSKDSSDLAMN